MEKKTLFLSLLIFLAFFAGWGSAVTYRSIYFRHKDPQLRANVYFIYETVKGREVKRGGNVITNIGERYVRNTFGWDNQTAFNATQWIAVGNSTIAASKTKLDTEATTNGFDRKANASCVAWMNGTDYAYNVTSPKMTATGDIYINATSLHWNPTDNSDNNCFALAALPGGGQLFQSATNDNCTVIWVITWDGN